MTTLVPGKNKKMIGTGIIFSAAALLIIGNARAVLSSTKGLSRSDSQGPVTVTATYIPSDKTTDEIRFKVRLDTHSVNLDQYKLEDLAFIRFDDGKGKKSLGVTQQGGGHHITNILRFAGPVPKGAGEMNLTIRNVGGIAERTLTWKLPGE